MASKKPAAQKQLKPSAPAMKPEWWPIEKIRPYPRNPRTHPPAQITMLAALFKKRGVDQPIVVDEEGVVLKGHGRRLAAIEGGYTSFPVVVQRGLSPAEKSALRIEDNQVSLLSGWDQELIKLEISNLKLANYPVQELGFGDAQLVSFETQPGPPAQFPVFDESIPTAHQCPSCGYKWSGNSAPIEGKPEKDPKSPKPKKPATPKKKKT